MKNSMRKLLIVVVAFLLVLSLIPRFSIFSLWGFWNEKSISTEKVSGTISAPEITSDQLVIKTISSDLRIDAIHAANSDISTTSGDIHLGNLNGGAVQVKSVSGNLSVTTQEELQKDMTLQSVSGDILLQLPVQSSINLRCSSVSGDCTTRLPLENRSSSDNSLSGSLGSGQHTVSLNTTSGNIHTAQ